MEEEFTKRFDRLEGMVEDLAAATAQGFAKVEERFQEVDEKFIAIDKKFVDLEEKLTSKIEGVQRSVDGNYERQSALEARVSKVETTLRL